MHLEERLRRTKEIEDQCEKFEKRVNEVRPQLDAKADAGIIFQLDKEVERIKNCRRRFTETLAVIDAAKEKMGPRLTARLEEGELLMFSSLVNVGLHTVNYLVNEKALK